MSDFDLVSNNGNGSDGTLLAPAADLERLRARAARAAARPGEQRAIEWREDAGAAAGAPRGLRAALITALKEGVRRSPKSRAQIADEMERLSGLRITSAMLDAYLAETNQNNFPAHLVPAFAIATGSREALDLICAAAGYYLADQRQHDLARLAEVGLEEERIRRNKRSLKKRLEGDTWRVTG